MKINDLVFSVVGGDLRNACLASSLSAAGYKVYALFFDREVTLAEKVIRSDDIRSALEDSDVMILPLPATLDDVTVNSPFSLNKILLSDCIAAAGANTLVLAGKVTPELYRMAQQAGVEILDYLEREEFSVLNAIPTAEGAAAIAMEELPITLFGSSCLVTGFGRVSRALVRLLLGMGAHVTVAARKFSDLAWAKSWGAQAVQISRMKEVAHQFDVVFNTVPAPVVHREILCVLKRDCLVVDLASRPGGVDFELAKEMQIRAIWALSLPGKVAPVTAGEIICDTVLNILSEKAGLV